MGIHDKIKHIAETLSNAASGMEEIRSDLTKDEHNDNPLIEEIVELLNDGSEGIDSAITSIENLDSELVRFKETINILADKL